jgi:hypothetical protein
MKSVEEFVIKTVSMVVGYYTVVTLIPILAAVYFKYS